jgi:uncharacterized DUF497 family protein
MRFLFDWNPRKVEIHLSKHGVSFDDAMVVFLDPRALTIFDEDHSDDEERWITRRSDRTAALARATYTC